MNTVPVVFSMLVAVGSFAWTLTQPTHHINAAPYVQGFANKMNWACQTGKPIEINDGYWIHCRKGVDV